MEERVMDAQTGRVLNPDMEFYKLAGAADIGEIIVHMDIKEELDKRGIIGLGEPPTVGGVAAIANAVANAKWPISATPKLFGLEEVCKMAAALGIHEQVREDAQLTP